MNDAQFGGVFNLVGKNISCDDGNCAVMVSPHAMTNGVVRVDGVKSEGCGFAVRVEGGFVSKKYQTEGLKPGTFAEGSFVKNIEASFGKNAQLKQKHLKYASVKLDELIKVPDEIEFGDPFVGPSIAAVLNDANYEVLVENVSATGFEFAPDIITEPVPGKAKSSGARKGQGKNRKNGKNKIRREKAVTN